MAVAFDQDGRRLSGTLTLPVRQAEARVPAIVIVHGSGALSRDGVMRGQLGLGFGFGFPAYARLAAALTAQGYAVLRYDKRTCGRFNGCADNDYPAVPPSLQGVEFTTAGYRRDALAAIAFLTAHEAVDPGRLFVVGHSQGGSLVPLILRDRADLRAGVMLAPPFHSIGELVQQQSVRLRWAYSEAGHPERGEQEYQTLEMVAGALRRLEAGRHWGEPILGESAATWESWIELGHEAPLAAAQLDRPLLVLGGDYDYNVAPTEIEAWRDHLRTSPVDHRVRVLPCVTHALNCITQSDPRRIEPADIGREIAPALVDEVLVFLALQAGTAPVSRLSPVL